MRGIDNTKNKDRILELLKKEEKKQNEILQTVDFGVLPETAGWRKIYDQFGSKPRDFRSSVEALLRRVRTGNPLPQINSLVDLGNYISIHFYLTVGVEDLDKIVGDLELGFAEGNERGRYLGSEGEETCYPGEVIYKDEVGFICRRWNWREGERTIVEDYTKNAVMVLEVLPETEEKRFNEILTETEQLAKDLLGGQITLKILSESQLEMEI